jgi:hypothetical protein
MSDGDGIKRFRKRRVRQYARRGHVYAWLRAYYRQVSTALKTGEKSWPGLVEVMIRDGITGRNGGKLTANAALKVWRRVERDVEVEVVRRGEERPKRKYPSRISPGWRPPIVQPPLSAGGAAPAAAPIGHGTEQAAEEPMSEHAREQHARLDKQIARIDAKFRF